MFLVLSVLGPVFLALPSGSPPTPGTMGPKELWTNGRQALKASWRWPGLSPGGQLSPSGLGKPSSLFPAQPEDPHPILSQWPWSTPPSHPAPLAHCLPASLDEAEQHHVPL